MSLLLEATHDVVACCKPQAAFFEALGPAGWEALQQVVARAREFELPVIVDAKRGDIGSTAAAYADAYLADDAPFPADALTVNAYLGRDSLAPFVERATATGRGLFVLVKTSNPGGRDLQDLELSSGQPLYLHLASLVQEASAGAGGGDAAGGYGPVGAVVGATNPSPVIRALRYSMPSSLLLLPGFGAQGAGAVDVVEAFDESGHGAVVSASRSLNYPDAVGAGASLAESVSAARAAAIAMRDAIEGALAARREA